MKILQVKNLSELSSNAGFWDNFIWPLSVAIVIGIAICFRKKIASQFSKKEITHPLTKERPIKDNSIKVIDNKNSSIHIGDNLVYNYNVAKEKELEKYNLNVLEFEATEISKIINESPPFQKNQTASNYKGIRIQWEVNLYSVNVINGNIAHVMSLYKNNYPWVNFNVNLESYPIFKIANKDKTFIVTGKIIKTDGATYDIDVETIE